MSKVLKWMPDTPGAWDMMRVVTEHAIASHMIRDSVDISFVTPGTIDYL